MHWARTAAAAGASNVRLVEKRGLSLRSPHKTVDSPLILGKVKQMEFKFQSNTRHSRPVLSVITLALQLVQHGMTAFPPRELDAALERLRYDHPVLQL